MIGTYAADRPFRVRFIPISVGVAEGQRAAEIRISDFMSLEEAMASKDRPPQGYAADRITRGADDVVVWPSHALSAGDAVWIDENTDGGMTVTGTLVGLMGMTDQHTTLWQVRLDVDGVLVAVPGQLLRPRGRMN